MFKNMSTVISVVLATALPALATVAPSNQQSFAVEGANVGSLVGGGTIANANLAFVSETQHGSDETGLIRTAQAELGMLGQGFGIGSVAGVFSVWQGGLIDASQTQLSPGGAAEGNLGAQLQTFDSSLDQAISTVGGQGMVVGLQAVTGVQVQVIATPWGVNFNMTPVMANVYGDLVK